MRLSIYPRATPSSSSLDPPLFYSIAMTLSLACEGPFVLNLSPVHSFWDVFDRIYIVMIYWGLTGLSNYVQHSYEITDPNNNYSVVLREQQYEYGFSWVRFLGTVSGLRSAMTGKQPKWNAFGMAGGTNLLFELPNLFAFLAMLGAVVLNATNYTIALVNGTDGLPWLHGPNDIPFARMIGCQTMGLFVLLNLWPVATLTVADLLNVPYYVVRNTLTTVVASMGQIFAGLTWVALMIPESDLTTAAFSVSKVD